MRISGEVALLIVSSALAIAIAELAFRYVHDAPPFDEPIRHLDYLHADEATLRWRFSSAAGRNSLGLRNQEISPKSPDQYRILFLGDSLIWSGDTTSGALYTEVIERQLNQQVALPGMVFDVINAGIPGYTTYQELEFLRLHGLEMEPDLVVLGFVFNDVYYKYLHRLTKEDRLDFEPAARLNQFDTTNFPGLVPARSYLAHELHFFLARALKKLDRMVWGEDGYPWFSFEFDPGFYLAWKEHGWTNTARLLAEMQRTLSQKQIKFVVLVFPIAAQFDNAYQQGARRSRVFYPQTRIGEIVSALGVAHLDLTDALQRGGGKDLFVDALHLNGSGNDLVAEHAGRFLINFIRAETQREEVGSDGASAVE